MKVFKFGGASVKNSDSIRNIVEIIRSYGTNELIVVVSAMDKTTNALENVLELYLKNNSFPDIAIWAPCNFPLQVFSNLFLKVAKRPFIILEAAFRSFSDNTIEMYNKFVEKKMNGGSGFTKDTTETQNGKQEFSEQNQIKVCFE